MIGGALQEPAASGLVVGYPRVVTGGDALSANLPGDNQQLIELQVVVAQAAGDRSASGNVLFHERAHHITLEALFVIDHIVRDADLLGDAAGVVDIVERAAASLNGLGHALASGETALVPELHGQTDDIVAVGTEHGRNGGRIHTARHSYRDGVVIQLSPRG